MIARGQGSTIDMYAINLSCQYFFKVLLTTKRKELLKAKAKAKKDGRRPAAGAPAGRGGGPRTPVGGGARSQQMQQPRSAPGRIRDALRSVVS